MIIRYLDPKNDIAFKRIFGQEKNKEILLVLLNEVLKDQIKNPIKDVHFLSPFQEPEALAQKQSIVDVLCRDEEGTQYIIEMQVARQKGFRKRAEFYASRAFWSQMGEGEEYEHLKAVIFLAFCNFSLFPKKEHYKSDHKSKDTRTGEHDMNSVNFTFVELPKFEKQRHKEISELSQEEKFYYFLLHAPHTSPEDLAVLTKHDKVMEKAYQELNKVYWTKEEIDRYEDQKKRIRDNKAIIDCAREESKEEGIKLGEERAKQEMAKQMLVEKEPLEKIKKYTGLTSQSIEHLKKEMEDTAHRRNL